MPYYRSQRRYNKYTRYARKPNFQPYYPNRRPAYKRRYYKDPLMAQAETRVMLAEAKGTAIRNEKACSNAKKAGIPEDQVISSENNMARMDAETQLETYETELYSMPAAKRTLISLDTMLGE